MKIPLDRGGLSPLQAIIQALTNRGSTSCGKLDGRDDDVEDSRGSECRDSGVGKRDNRIIQAKSKDTVHFAHRARGVAAFRGVVQGYLERHALARMGMQEIETHLGEQYRQESNNCGKSCNGSLFHRANIDSRPLFARPFKKSRLPIFLDPPKLLFLSF